MAPNVTQMETLLKRLKELDLAETCAPEPSIRKTTVVDEFDLRYITKLEAKKISHGDIVALLKYGNHYLKEESGKFLIKTKKGRQYADFEEAGVNKEIATCLTVLTQELKRRQE